MKASEEVVLLAAAVGVGALAVLAVKAYHKPSPTPIVPVVPAPLVTPTSGGGANVTLVPGMASQTLSLNVYDPVVINVPTGGSFESVDGAPFRGTTPYVFVFRGPISHTFVWMDATGTQTTTLMVFSLNPNGTPSVVS